MRNLKNEDSTMQDADAVLEAKIENALWQNRQTTASLWKTVVDNKAEEKNQIVPLCVHRLVKNQTTISEQFVADYLKCNLAFDQAVNLAQIEAYLAALSSASANSNVLPSNDANVKSIMIAQKVLFDEFKKNQHGDAYQRLPLFLNQICKLISELTHLVQLNAKDRNL